MNEAAISMKSLANALGYPVRWKALRELATGEPLLTVELSERIGVAANTLSRHMKILLVNGLVSQNRAGQYTIPMARIVSKEERVVDYGTCLLRLGGDTIP
jgi:DNA-binding transcriptional ArsR family regulator